MIASGGNLGAGKKGCEGGISYCLLYTFNSFFKIVTMKLG